MKKVILLVTVLLSTISISCGNDDDTLQDPIIGKWKIDSFFDNDTFITLSECEKQSIIEHNSDGTFTTTTFFVNEGGCEEIITTGNWENKGNDIYLITLDEENLEGFDVNITFPNDELTIISNTGKSVYVRVN